MESYHAVRDCCMSWTLGDVEPVDNMGCRFRHGARQGPEDFSAIREHGDVAITAIPFPPKRMQSSIPDCPLPSAGGDEIAAADLATIIATDAAPTLMSEAGSRPAQLESRAPDSYIADRARPFAPRRLRPGSKARTAPAPSAACSPHRDGRSRRRARPHRWTPLKTSPSGGFRDSIRFA